MLLSAEQNKLSPNSTLQSQLCPARSLGPAQGCLLWEMLLGAPDEFRVTHQSCRNVHGLSQHPQAALLPALQGVSIHHLEPMPLTLLNTGDGKRFYPVGKAFPVLLWPCGGEARKLKEVTACSTLQCVTPGEIPAGFWWALQPPPARAPLVWLRKARVLPLHWEGAQGCPSHGVGVSFAGCAPVKLWREGENQGPTWRSPLGVETQEPSCSCSRGPTPCAKAGVGGVGWSLMPARPGDMLMPHRWPDVHMCAHRREAGHEGNNTLHQVHWGRFY